MKKCNHPYSKLEERSTYQGDYFYRCTKCNEKISGWGYFWRKWTPTILACALIFGVVQGLIYLFS